MSNTTNYKEWLAKMNEACVEAIKKGDNDNRHHAIVMLYSRLAEVELALSVITQSVEGLNKQLEDPISSTYMMLINGEENKEEGELYLE